MGDLITKEDPQTSKLESGEVPFPEVIRLLEENSEEIAPKIYTDYEQKFPESDEPGKNTLVDQLNRIVLVNSSRSRLIRLYLSPEAAAEDTKFYQHFPAVEFRYENHSGEWRFEDVFIHSIDSEVPTSLRMMDHSESPLMKAFYWRNRTKMEYMEKQLGKYITPKEDPKSKLLK